MLTRKELKDAKQGTVFYIKGSQIADDESVGTWIISRRDFIKDEGYYIKHTAGPIDDGYFFTALKQSSGKRIFVFNNYGVTWFAYNSKKEADLESLL